MQGIVTVSALVFASVTNQAQAAADDLLGAREALVQLAAEARAQAPEPVRTEVEAHEAALGLPLEAVRFEGVRVLSTTGVDEAQEVARAMAATRWFFTRLTEATASYPHGCTVYLLGRKPDRDLFLGQHPRVDSEARAWMEKMEGAGVPKTADWAFWVASPEKRREWSVRFALDWLMREAYGLDIGTHAWLHEGAGLYLADVLVGTRSTWFVQPRKRASTAELALRIEEPFQSWLDLARPLFAEDQKFDLEELLHLQPAEFDLRDHLRAHALVAHTIETRRADFPSLLARTGGGEDPRLVLEEISGLPLPELRGEIAGWLERRESALARAEGRLTDAELNALWKPLDAAAKQLAIAEFQRRLEALDIRLLRALRGLLADAPTSVPKAEDRLPYFDPRVHAPAQPIPRKRLRPTDSRAKKMLAATRVSRENPVLRTYDYDWSAHAVVRIASALDPDAVFHNALLGLPPDADLARAILLSRLDREDERRLHEAFGHAYTDRDGNVFPVTLYEVWSAGVEKEMPDVDTLGLVHEVLDEWKRWTAPVPASQHATLYELLDRLAKQCIRSRELREFVADLYLAPDPLPPAGYDSLIYNLHTQWVLVEDDPDRMAAALPGGEERDGFLEALTNRCMEDVELFGQGRRRAAVMRRDVQQVRKTLARVLTELPGLSEPGAR